MHSCYVTAIIPTEFCYHYVESKVASIRCEKIGTEKQPLNTKKLQYYYDNASIKQWLKTFENTVNALFFDTWE